MRLKLLNKNPVDHSTREVGFAPETLERKGFPDIAAHATRMRPEVPATAHPQTVVKSRRIGITGHCARTTGGGQTRRGAAKFRTEGLGETTGVTTAPE